MPTPLITLSQISQPDHQRALRTGIPEIILADGKSIAQTISIATSMLQQSGRAILSRVSPALYDTLQQHFPAQQIEQGESGTTIIIRSSDAPPIAANGGAVGILTAGTSDLPIAEEAAIICREAGCRVQMACDVGVAGIHRLHEPLEQMITAHPVDVLIVVAGMDGALPSVVAGLVALPVIGLPTSIGYGMGGNGEAALLSMLQSCATGLAVVNIDNGIGAGAMAVRIALNAAFHRTHLKG